MTAEHSYRPGIPEEILALTEERDVLRRRGQYDRADLLKEQIEKALRFAEESPEPDPKELYTNVYANS